MTPEAEAALVERVAKEIDLDSPCVMTHDETRSLARAALAVIEPAVREECAKAMDARRAAEQIMRDIARPKDENIATMHGDRAQAFHEAAAAIRRPGAPA